MFRVGHMASTPLRCKDGQKASADAKKGFAVKRKEYINLGLVWSPLHYFLTRGRTFAIDMARHFASFIILSVFIWIYGTVVLGIPAPQDLAADTTLSPPSNSTVTTTATPTSTSSPSSSDSSSDSPAKYPPS